MCARASSRSSGACGWQYPRRERGTGRHDSPARAYPGGGRAGLHAAAPGAGVAPENARSGRPPSRRRCRPRAIGTSGSGAGHRVRAAQALMFSMKGTRVRKVRRRSDGSSTNMCTCCAGRREMACWSGVRARTAATALA
jgi:hypothetical protein